MICIVNVNFSYRYSIRAMKYVSGYPQPFHWSQTPDQTHHFYGAISCPLEKRSPAIIWSSNTFPYICRAFISQSGITMSLRAAWTPNTSQAPDCFTRAVYAPLTCNLHTRRPSHSSPETLHACTQVYVWCIVSDSRAFLQRNSVVGVTHTKDEEYQRECRKSVQMCDPDFIMNSASVRLLSKVISTMAWICNNKKSLFYISHHNTNLYQECH